MRLLVQEEPDEVGHEGVDGLVVRHPRPRGVDDGDVPGAPGPDQPRHPHLGVPAEHLGVEVEVVDPAVDDVDALEPVDRLHGDRVVVEHDQVVAGHELHPQLLGQEGVLEVGGVVGPGGEHDDGRLVDRGRDRGQQGPEVGEVGIDRLHAVGAEQLGEDPLGHHPVLDHVGDARGHPQVVLQHVDGPVGVAHEVAAADVGPDGAERAGAHALGTEVRRIQDELGRHDARPHGALLVVAVVDEAVQRLQALDQPRLDPLPLAGHDDARDEVERPRALGRRLMAVDAEGDADGTDLALGRRLVLAQRRETDRLQVAPEGVALRAQRPVAPHVLVVTAGQLVVRADRGGHGAPAPRSPARAMPTYQVYGFSGSGEFLRCFRPMKRGAAPPPMRVGRRSTGVPLARDSTDS